MEDVQAYVSKLKVVELKEELKKRGLSTAGVKSVLAQRLQESMLKEQQEESVAESMEEQSAEGESAQAEVPEGNTMETQAEQEQSTEAMQQEEQQEVHSDEKLEDTQEPSQPEPTPMEQEPTPVIPEPTPVESEPTPDVPEPEQPAKEESTSTDSTAENKSDQPSAQEETAEAESAPIDGDNAPKEGDDAVTQQSEADEAVPNVNKAENEASESAVPDADDKEPSQQEETTETAATEETPATEDAAIKAEQSEGAEKEEQKMDTSSSEAPAKPENGHTQESTQIGGKRPYSSDDSSKPSEKTKPDPSKAPDPEEPEAFDENQVLMENKFQPPEDDSIITLHKYTSDLFFNIREDGLGGCGLTEQGFARLWASTRGSIGTTGGRYYYQVRVEENMEVDLPTTEEHPHAIRVGWTLDDSRKGLGEDKYSYGYGSTGRKAFNDKFENYGENFGPGDVIGCYLDLESSPRTISFSKNNASLGTAFTLEDSISGKTLFPCISTKNVSFSVNFGGSPAWCEVEGIEDYSLLQEVTEEHKRMAPLAPTTATDCEVVMMIGLPASGKTTWAEKQCDKYPEKRYNILGTNLIMERMKVSGLSRKENYRARFEALIKEATKILNKLFLLAAKDYRNYIIDQTNVYKSAQIRKMKYFEGFLHKAAVVVPPHHELRRRTALRNEEMGGPLPEDAINAMKANFHIPKTGDVFQDVCYSDIYGMAAEKIVRQYREDALGLPSYPQSKRGRYDYRSGGGPRYGGHGGHRSGGHSGYHQYGGSGGGSYGSYGSSYNSRNQYGHGGGNSYSYQQRPRYGHYRNPAPPPPMYGSPRGSPYGGPPNYQRSPYNSPGHYQGHQGHYGGPPPPRRGGNSGYYYGRY